MFFLQLSERHSSCIKRGNWAKCDLMPKPKRCFLGPPCVQIRAPSMWSVTLSQPKILPSLELHYFTWEAFLTEAGPFHLGSTSKKNGKTKSPTIHSTTYLKINPLAIGASLDHWNLCHLLPPRMGFLAFGLDVRFAMPRIAITMLALVSLTNLRNQVLTLVPSSGDTSWMEARRNWRVLRLVGLGLERLLFGRLQAKKGGFQELREDAGASNHILGFVRVIRRL